MQSGRTGSHGSILLTEMTVCFVIFAARLTQMYDRSLELGSLKGVNRIDWIKSSSTKGQKPTKMLVQPKLDVLVIHLHVHFPISDLPIEQLFFLA